MVFDLTLSDPLARVNAFWALCQSNKDPQDTTWDTTIYPHITPLSATVHTPTSCTARFLLTVHPTLCNRTGNLHGGCAATIFDTLTSVTLAPVAQEGKFSYGGVSRTLNCTYLKPVRMGMKVLVECETVGLGGRLAHTRGVMREWDREKEEVRGEVLVTCEHGKANTDPPVSKL